MTSSSLSAREDARAAVALPPHPLPPLPGLLLGFQPALLLPEGSNRGLRGGPLGLKPCFSLCHCSSSVLGLTRASTSPATSRRLPNRASQARQSVQTSPYRGPSRVPVRAGRTIRCVVAGCRQAVHRPYRIQFQRARILTTPCPGPAAGRAAGPEGLGATRPVVWPDWAPQGRRRHGDGTQAGPGRPPHAVAAPSGQP